MKRRKKIYFNLIVDLFLVGCIYYFLLVKQGESFEHAAMVGDWNRIPLWKLHEIIDFGSMNVRLHNWYAWGTPIDDHIVVYKKDRPDLETIALQRLKDILTLSVGDGVVCGTRYALAQPFGGNLGIRYFVFATNQIEVAYFKETERNEFLKECEKYGVDGANLKDFQDCWEEFWSKRTSLNPLELIRDGFTDGFTMGESVVGLMLLFVSFIVVRRQWSWLWTRSAT